MDTAGIDFRIEPNLSAEEFIDVLQRSTLAERRPVNEPVRIAEMLQNSQLIITARCNAAAEKRGLLVGVSRAITDFSFCTYLSDLAVDQKYQGRGIGKELIRRTHLAAGLRTRLILLAAPKAETYYGHIGMNRHHSCWQLPPVQE